MLRALASGTKPLTNICGVSVREALDLSPSAFLDFCILLGTDASERLHMVGPAKAYNLIRKYGSIEAILVNEPKVAAKVKEGWMDTVEAARNVFQDLPPLPAPEELEEQKMDLLEVERWLKETHGVLIPYRIGFDFQSQLESEVERGVELEKEQRQHLLGVGTTLESLALNDFAR